ncbi:PLP-dependent aminotransferase family protein [Sporomusa sphaeroides DSM 2875]|uniref:MocR-like pyridoxine biosynthesis transcription factor PdxR n=1 Tax=Sporomusa sphaeroides TaxID=47679 RepID=UPI00202EDFFE|nr:PLP-dependent aminotransferase family protein [Sporomusa sphaeroides]MCM0758216.1 PLP-dependent aminotransferase family protein [Sporomusa sphaeroides DSM 2875]
MWGIELRYKDEVSLARQIFLSLKQRILAGEISQGEALPSTRELAKGLGASRNTVCEAYDMLLTEGFIVSHQGAPSRVAAGLHLTTKKNPVPAAKKQEQAPILWDFKTGQPDLSQFPRQLWSQLVHAAANTLTTQQLEYSGPKGYEPLCEEIAHWLLRSRSMEVKPEDVFITSGATAALHLLVNILNKAGHAFALESPSHPGIRTVIADRGYPLQWLLVDEQGADISTLQGKNVCAVYVTPSHQFPLGGILPAGRRAALLRLASEHDFYIIEDDYDSEFRYTGPPVSPIYSMDSSHVIYVGTFSKTLFPALRIGFVVLPKQLQKSWRHSRNYMDVQNPILEQAALTQFLHMRKMDKHVQRMRRIYGEKRKVLLNSLENTFGASVQQWGDASGLHLALCFQEMEFGKQFVHDCRDAGIRISLVTQYCPMNDHHKDKLLLGYGHLSHIQIQKGIQALYEFIAERA